MTLFPAWFFVLLVYGGIALTAVGAAVLIVLLLRDLGGKKLW
jgi:hypothetical protein